MFCVIAGPELDAQISATHSPGVATRRRHQRSNHRPRTRGIQDVHIPRVRLHSRHRVSESTCKYHTLTDLAHLITIDIHLPRMLFIWHQMSWSYCDHLISKIDQRAKRLKSHSAERLSIDECYLSRTNCISLKGMSSLNKGRWHIIFCVSAATRGRRWRRTDSAADACATVTIKVFTRAKYKALVDARVDCVQRHLGYYCQCFSHV